MTKFNEGDQVYLYSYGYDAISRAVITRVTKTQAIIENERYAQKFNRETGRLIGAGTWNSTSIAHPNEHLDHEWAAHQVRSARRALARAAENADPDSIRAAFARWDQLQRGVTS